MFNLIAASAYFLLIHFGVSGTRLRDALVARLGEGPYRGAFALASVIGLVWMIYGYRRAPTVDLWGQLPGLRPLAFALVFVAFLFVGIGLATPSPTQVGSDLSRECPNRAKTQKAPSRQSDNLQSDNLKIIPANLDLP